MSGGFDGRSGPAGAALEARYRRLLRWFPRGHRVVHGDEMLGVLMAGARDGQRGPGVGESVDLVAAAVRIRLRRFSGWLAGERWRDAFAVLSVVAPVLMVVVVAESANLGDGLLAPVRSGHFAGWRELAVQSRYSAIPLLVAWGVATVLVLAGLRRAAAVVAGLAAVAGIALGGPVLNLLAPRTVEAAVSPAGVKWIFLEALTIASLVWSPGPRRGLAILGRRWMAALVAGALAYACARQTSVLWQTGLIRGLLGAHVSLPAFSRAGSAFTPAGFVIAMVTWAALAPVAVLCLRGPVGRRVIALAAPAAALNWLVYLAGAGPWALSRAENGVSAPVVYRAGVRIADMSHVVAVAYLTLAVAVCVLAAASSRGPQRAASSMLPGVPPS